MNTASAVWMRPPAEVKITTYQVHVWRGYLDLSPDTLGQLSRLLSPDELEKAGRFYFQKDRNRFIAAHAYLRQVLAKYLDASPAQLQFESNSFGKPFLVGGSPRDSLQFNLSHSHAIGLIAIAHGRQVGVDVELIRSDFANEEIARRFFSSSEVAALFSLPQVARVEGFFNCWTRKEAYIKARGEGLSHPLNQFDVSVLPGEPAALLASRADPSEPMRWSFFSLEPGDGYTAALAVEGRSLQLHCWEWNGGNQLGRLSRV